MNVLAVLFGLAFLGYDVFEANASGWKASNVLGDILMYGGISADVLLVFGGLLQPMYVGYAVILYGIFRIVRSIADLVNGPPPTVTTKSKAGSASITIPPGLFYTTRAVSIFVGLIFIYWGYTMTIPVAVVGGRGRKYASKR